MTADPHAIATTKHSPVAGLPHDARGGIGNPVLGMLLFITSEVMFFAGLFAAYFNARANYINEANVHEWPPAEFGRDGSGQSPEKEDDDARPPLARSRALGETPGAQPSTNGKLPR